MVERLTEEHRAMRAMVESFRRPRGRELKDELFRFGSILEKHIHSEERELFPGCEEGFTESQLEIIAQQIKHYPDGGEA